MTRDEAISLAWAKTTNPKLVAEGIVDALAELGLLKLDEPRSTPLYRGYEALFEFIPTLDFLAFKHLIDKANLKIVEK